MNIVFLSDTEVSCTTSIAEVWIKSRCCQKKLYENHVKRLKENDQVSEAKSRERKRIKSIMVQAQNFYEWLIVY